MENRSELLGLGRGSLQRGNIGGSLGDGTVLHPDVVADTQIYTWVEIHESYTHKNSQFICVLT